MFEKVGVFVPEKVWLESKCLAPAKTFPV